MTNDDEKVMMMTYGIKKSNAHTSDAFFRVKLVCGMVVVVIAHNVLLDFIETYMTYLLHTKI